MRADVTVLHDLGLVEAKAGPWLRDAVSLSVPYQRIQLEIAVQPCQRMAYRVRLRALPGSREASYSP